MKAHTKVYLKHFGYDMSSFISCEICGTKAVDIHHIHRRGTGGSDEADRVENLQAICRSCHWELGDKKQHKANLYILHLRALKAGKKPFDEKWINEQIKKYANH